LNKTKVLRIKGKVKVILQIQNEKKKADVHQKFGLIYSKNQTIWENRTKIISVFEWNRLRKNNFESLNKVVSIKLCIICLGKRDVTVYQ
jgi:hypothetical protein